MHSTLERHGLILVQSGSPSLSCRFQEGQKEGRLSRWLCLWTWDRCKHSPTLQALYVDCKRREKDVKIESNARMRNTMQTRHRVFLFRISGNTTKSSQFFSLLTLSPLPKISPLCLGAYLSAHRAPGSPGVAAFDADEAEPAPEDDFA